jgi:hypothetical protein
MMNLTWRGLFLLIFLGFTCTCYSQYDSPVSYMSYLTTIEEDLAKDYMNYMSATAHGGSARKMERRRSEVLSTISEGRKKVAALKAYQKETALREAYATYFLILESVINEDYSKIVNMEEIAEQSFDAMEAYLLAQEKASDRLQVAADTLQNAYRQFAAQHNVRLVESESKVSRKLKQTGRVMNYYNLVYLIYFKSSKQEVYMIEATNSGNINSVEQNKSTMIKYADEGLKKLDTLKPFDRDYSPVIACRKLLEFYKMEANNKIPLITNYFMKKEEFTKYKKAYDAKSTPQKTRQDIENYNTFVSEINKTGTVFNQTNQDMNTQRASLTDNWSTTLKKFLDVHVPVK